MMMGFPKSASDSMMVSRNALAIPGRSRGSVTFQKVCHRPARRVRLASSRAGLMDSTTLEITRNATGAKDRVCARARPGKPKIPRVFSPIIWLVTNPWRPKRRMMAMPTTKGGVMMGRRENARNTPVNRERDRAAASAKTNPMRVEVQLTKTARPRLFLKTRQNDG